MNGEPVSVARRGEEETKWICLLDCVWSSVFVIAAMLMTIDDDYLHVRWLNCKLIAGVLDVQPHSGENSDAMIWKRPLPTANWRENESRERFNVFEHVGAYPESLNFGATGRAQNDHVHRLPLASILYRRLPPRRLRQNGRILSPSVPVDRRTANLTCKIAVLVHCIMKRKHPIKAVCYWKWPATLCPQPATWNANEMEKKREK